MLKVAAFHIEDLNSNHLNSIGLYLKEIYSYNQSNPKISLTFLGPNNSGIGKIPSIGLFKSKNKKGLVPISFLTLLKLIPKISYLKKFDILWFQHIIYVLPALLMFKRPKIVLIVHGRKACNIIPYYYYPFKLFLVSFTEKIVIKRCSKIIVLNNDDLNFYQKNFPKIKDRFVLVPTFYNDRIFKLSNKEEAKKRLKLTNQKIFIYTGRLVRSKGLEFCLKIFTAYLRANKAAVFLIIGSGDQKKPLENEAKRMKIANKVKFIDHLENRNLAIYYQAADVFLLSSAGEGLPISCLEAMACGTPILAKCAVGINELVKNCINGYIFDQNKENINKIVAKAEKIFSNKKINISTVESVAKFRSSTVCPKIINELKR